MPELINLYEAHAAHRDRFEIIAIHDKTVQSFAELDPKLLRLKHEFWEDKDLPFPVLLDATGATIKLYGIHAFPTGLLIDPSGKLVGEASPADLESKLPSLSAEQQWAEHRDVYKNIFWEFEPTGANTPTRLAALLGRWTHCRIELDLPAIQASGLKPDSILPGAVAGLSITVRSIEDLLLAPHGLGIAPSPDGKKLLITRRLAQAERESYLQKLHASELNARLDHAPPGGSAEGAKPLEIHDEPLLAAIKQIAHAFDLPMALDARAALAGKLDPKAKVSGRVDPGRLRASLVATLRPLGLTVEVRDEVVLVTAAPRKSKPTSAGRGSAKGVFDPSSAGFGVSYFEINRHTTFRGERQRQP